MSKPDHVRAVDLDALLQEASEKIAENIRRGHFRRLRGRRAEVSTDDAPDLKRLLAELDQEDEEGEDDG